MIGDDLAQLLEPLERFEDIRRGVVRLGDRLCDLSYANPYDGVAPGVLEALANALTDERTLGLQYAPFGGHTYARRAVADALRASHDADFIFRDVVLTPGAMTALTITLRAIARPDGEVIVPVPCWLDHPLYVRAAGLRPVLVPSMPGTLDLDIARVADAVTARTCAVVVTQPGNPTGRIHSTADIQALAGALHDRAERTGATITLIADETHRDFADPGRFRRFGDHHPRTVVVYSFGKYHLIQGQRLGYAAVWPDHPERRAVADELVRWTRITGTATPTSLMQRALPRLLQLSHDAAWVDKRRAVVVDGLRQQGWTVVEPDATLFVYAAIPGGRDEFAFTRDLAARGVLCLPAPVFHHHGHIRISLTASDAMLDRAMTILSEVGT